MGFEGRECVVITGVRPCVWMWMVREKMMMVSSVAASMRVVGIDGFGHGV